MTGIMVCSSEQGDNIGFPSDAENSSGGWVPLFFKKEAVHSTVN
jgi:hypothetical protein